MTTLRLQKGLGDAKYSLSLQFSKCGTQTTSITWGLVGNANSQPHLRRTESATLGMGTTIQGFQVILMHI